MAAFRRDRTSGASELAREALQMMDEAASRGISARRLAQLANRLAAAHPAMGAVWNAAHARDRKAFAHLLKRGPGQAARALRKLLPRRSRVVTLSYSSTVLAALSRRDLTVVVAESLPGREGRTTAQRLRKAGVRAEVIRDAELARALEAADAAVVGADAVTPTLVINKVGTRLLALAARHVNVPCYVVADRSKCVPRSWTVPDFDDHPLFEATPRRLVTDIVTGAEL